MLLSHAFSLQVPDLISLEFVLQVHSMICYMLWLAACCLLLLLYSARFKSSCIHGHGPRRYPVIGCLVAFYRNRRRLLDWYTELLAASPTQTIVVYRLGARRTVVTANPANVEHILKSNFGNYPKGKPFTDVLGDLLGTGIFNVDGEMWYAQRKLVSHEFSARALRELELAVLEDEARERLVPALGHAAARGDAVDMQELLRRFAFDVISRVSLGVDPGCLDPALPAPRLAAAFDTAAGIIARRGAAPVAAVWKAKRAVNLGSERRLREEIVVIHQAVMDLIHSRKKELALLNGHGERRRSDLLSRMLECGYPDEAIRDMVISFIMAGRDTTSSVLTWFFWLLTRHRDVEQEVLREITGGASHAAGGQGKMRVLHAALCETMRLYPPVAWDSKHAAAADVLPDGTRVERGDRVTYFQYGMGRMESIWGADAAEFSLQRWLSLPVDTAPTAVGGVSPFKYPVFQGGPRTCLGKEMAFVQMKFVASSVLRRFELVPVDEGRVPAFLPLMTAHMAGGLNVKKPRGRGDRASISVHPLPNVLEPSRPRVPDGSRGDGGRARDHLGPPRQDAIHALSRAHYLRAIRRRAAGDKPPAGLVYVKSRGNGDEEASLAALAEEATSLHAIRAVLEDLEDQFECFLVYKFNIFYPDLVDKSRAPTYSIEKGFKCTFERGILHLYFNFKRYRYRR